MTKHPTLPSLEPQLSNAKSLRNGWMDADDGSLFSDQISQSLAAVRAAEWRTKQTKLSAQPADIRQRALDRAWDCWCNLTGMDAWNHPGILQSLHTVHTGPRKMAIRCDLNRVQGRGAFPCMKLSWSSPQIADVRFELPSRQRLDQARTWQSELGKLEATGNWPEMLLSLAQLELHKVRPEIAQVKRSQSSAQRELEACIASWVEATWRLLQRGLWASLQGEELHLGDAPEEALEWKPTGTNHPFWEWRRGKRTQILLALRLIRPSASGKRWLVEGVQVSDDLFSSPQGQTTFTTWKRTFDLKKGLHDHFRALLIK